MTHSPKIASLAAIVTAVSLLAAAPVAAQPAQVPPVAQQVRMDPEDAIGMMRDAGFRAEVVSRTGRSVDIETRMSGFRVYLTLLGCEADRQCQSAQLRMTADLKLVGLNPDQRNDVEATMIGINNWNSTRRYTRAYVYFSNRDRQHVIAVESDLSFGGGVHADAVRNFARLYDELVGEFFPFMRNGDNRRLANY